MKLDDRDDAWRALVEVLREVHDPVSLLAGMFQNAPVAFQIYRADGHSLVVNPAFLAMFGSQPPPEYSVLHDDIAAKTGVLESIRRAFAGELVRTPTIWYDPRELEQVRVVEGRRVFMDATFFPLRDADGRIGHIAIAFRDLTNERVAREQAERERDLLGLIIEQCGRGVVVVDASGVVRVFNAEAERQHGVSLRSVPPEEWTAAYGLRRLDGSAMPARETPLYRAFQGMRVDEERWMIERPDGTRRVLSGTATPLHTSDGARSGAVLITRDDTDLLADERRLRLHSTILTNVSDSIIVTDMEGRIVDWNRGAERIFGYREADVLGKTPSLLYPDRTPADLAADLARIQAGEDFVGEWQGRRKDGSIVWVEIKTTLLRDGEGRAIGFVGIGKDVTDRRRADEERTQALAMAEAASRAKDEFLAMLGHELRNPLTPIVTALQLMKLKGEDRFTREQEVIERQVDHLIRLVDDLLDVSRITRGKVALRRAPIDLGEAVVKAVEMASPLLESRHHRLQLDVPRTGMRLVADGARVAQILSNLLTNAAKYTPPGGSISLRARREGGEIVVTVEDNGIGIAPELLPHIFDLFVQGRRTSDRSEGGLGIGLTLVRNLVQLHGGSITARSDGAGRGSEFVVRLPASVEEAPRATSQAVSSLGIAPSRRPLRVLVVDDNQDAASLVAELLQAAGHEVAVAHSGPEALELAADFSPQLALLDIGLPVMDGYELARRLHAGRPSLRLIAMSGYGQEHDRARSGEAGFAEHLVKPVAPDTLLATVEKDAS